MLICQCRGISEQTIRQCVRRGESRMAQVARRTGAGVGCGTCRSAIRQVIRRELASSSEVVKADPVVQDEPFAPLS